MPIIKFDVDINGRLADPEFAREYVAVLDEEISGHRKRIAELEGALRELLDAFNPEPRVEEPGLIWGRAALALKGSS